VNRKNYGSFPISRVPLFIAISSIRARYGIMASQPSFSFSTEIPSGPIDLIFPFAATLFLMIFVSVVKDSFELGDCTYMLDVTLAAEYRRIVVIKSN